MVKNFALQMSVFVIMAFFIPSFMTVLAPVANESDLHKLIRVIEDNEGKVTEWSIIARESLDLNFSTEDLLQKMNRWEEQFPQFSWEKVQSPDRLEITGTFSGTDYEESLRIVANLKENTLNGFTLYELKGTSWNSNAETIINEKRTIIPQLFQYSPIIFSCIKGEFADKVDVAARKKALDLTDAFDGKIIEQLNEDDFVTITAKSPKFNQILKSESGRFNLQIAVRKGMPGEKTSFTVGTPIITTEY